MKRRDLILALLVVIVWGANFTVIKLGLAGMPPMLLAALRYTFAALPAIAFIKRPAVEWKYIVAYGMTVGVGQFSCLFYAMNIGMPAGISSIVLQSQVFFTLIFAAVLLKESLKGSQVAGLLVAGAGLCLIGGNVGYNGLSSIPVGAFLLTLLAAAFWGISNIIVRYASKQAASQGKTLDILSLVVWSSLVPPIPLLAIALLLDTPETLLNAMRSLNILSVFSVFYLAFCATIFGYGIWGILLSKYPTGKVAPLSLLVPVTGLITAQLILSEQLSKMQWIGGIIIILGLVISNFGFLPIQRIFKTKAE
ncbi:MAG: EamA family transporter [Clostridiaceae bacterium]|jgi:O-acetylserine/cysteine efflux transporter|nr:EamA family transporter [Clostridiaceae bacterium]